MNKEDVLALSRKENEGKCDERENAILNQSSKLSSAIGGLVCVLLAFIVDIVFDKPEISLCAWLVYFAMSCTKHWTLYAGMKKRSDLIYGIIDSVILIITIIVIPIALR